VQNPLPAVEDTYIAPQWGRLEFIRKMRQDQLSVLTPNIFDRRMLSGRLFRLRWFTLNWPDYIQHVLLDNHQNYIKGRFSDALLGRLQGQGLEVRSSEAMSLEDIFVTTVRAGGAA